jgi:hypothetical protein
MRRIQVGQIRGEYGGILDRLEKNTGHSGQTGGEYRAFWTDRRRIQGILDRQEENTGQSEQKGGG